MSKNSVFEDYQKALEGEPFPFKKYGLENKEPETEAEYQALLEKLKKLGLNDLEAGTLIAVSFGKEGWKKL